MDSTPSNGNSLRARTRKANTSPAEAPNGANGNIGTTPRLGRRASPSSPSRSLAPRQRGARPEWVERSGDLPPLETYPAIAIEDVQPELDGGHWPIKRVVGDQIQVS